MDIIVDVLVVIWVKIVVRIWMSVNLICVFYILFVIIMMVDLSVVGVNDLWEMLV